jgi:hypothetical protein
MIPITIEVEGLTMGCWRYQPIRKAEVPKPFHSRKQKRTGSKNSVREAPALYTPNVIVTPSEWSPSVLDSKQLLWMGDVEAFLDKLPEEPLFD